MVFLSRLKRRLVAFGRRLLSYFNHEQREFEENKIRLNSARQTPPSLFGNLSQDSGSSQNIEDLSNCEEGRGISEKGWRDEINGNFSAPLISKVPSLPQFPTCRPSLTDRRDKEPEESSNLPYKLQSEPQIDKNELRNSVPLKNLRCRSFQDEIDLVSPRLAVKYHWRTLDDELFDYPSTDEKIFLEYRKRNKRMKFPPHYFIFPQLECMFRKSHPFYYLLKHCVDLLMRPRVKVKKQPRQLRESKYDSPPLLNEYVCRK